MIPTAILLKINVVWEEAQFSDELQAIAAKHRNHFEEEKFITHPKRLNLGHVFKYGQPPAMKNNLKH